MKRLVKLFYFEITRRTLLTVKQVLVDLFVKSGPADKVAISNNIVALNLVIELLEAIQNTKGF